MSTRTPPGLWSGRVTREGFAGDENPGLEFEMSEWGRETEMDIRSLTTAIKHAQRTWRGRPDGWNRLQQAFRDLATAAERLQAALPFPTGVAYAYNPGEHATSNGATHIICEAPLRAGRLTREPGDALCQPAAKFWGLERRDERHASCARCLEIAARLASR